MKSISILPFILHLIGGSLTTEPSKAADKVPELKPGNVGCDCDDLQPCIQNMELKRAATVSDCATQCASEIQTGNSANEVAACFVQRDSESFRRVAEYR